MLTPSRGPCYKAGSLLVSNWLLIHSSLTSRRRMSMSIAGTSTADASLPDRFRDVNHLEEVMTSPSAALVADMARITGDIIILGVGGKMGPTLAQIGRAH